MRALIGCEMSGRVRSALRKRGHDAWSCDLLPAMDGSPYHVQGDVLPLLLEGWDLLIAFPPCTYLCSSGLHWNHRAPGRSDKTEESLEFVGTLLDAPIERIALENPTGCISTRIRKADQVIQPYQFGDDASKKTCLWLKNLPKLKAKGVGVLPRITADGKARWSNQTDSGQNRLGPRADRAEIRSLTYPGIAIAMAEQWTEDLTVEMALPMAA